MKQTSPKILSKNKTYKVEITGLTHEGQGVGKIDGFVVFVDNALIGEIVDVQITKQTKSYSVGHITKIQKPSEKRMEPFCPVYDKCGGCSIQHMSYKAQLDFKTDTVRQNLKRIGGLENVH
ncbi:MAG: TRAM domain-containing protein, partial [Ruminiclostridium sp.]